MAVVADRLGIDIWEVIEAAATKPYGFMKFLPGPGLGGHCIPVDPSYLSWKMKSLNFSARFIELATDEHDPANDQPVDLAEVADRSGRTSPRDEQHRRDGHEEHDQRQHGVQQQLGRPRWRHLQYWNRW